jgi:hypothetical protein
MFVTSQLLLSCSGSVVMRFRAIHSLAFALALLSWCPVTSASQERAGSREQQPVGQTNENEGSEFKQALKARLTGKADLTGLRLDVHWLRRSATVYGSGIGIWNREKQFTLTKAQIIALLKILAEGGFTKLKPRYGGLSRPVRGPALGAPEILMGNLTLTLGKVSKGSIQLGRGEQSKELAGLANKILDLCEQAAREGVSATDLSDGLRKVASGRLHPITLSLLVQRIENEGRGPNGWILRINGRQAEVQLRSKTGIAQPVRMELSEKQLGELCDLLLKNDAAGLPINLWAPDYTDFRVSIFRAEKSLQARKFARLTPTTHGEKQKHFNRIFAALDKLHQEIVNSKTPK